MTKRKYPKTVRLTPQDALLAAGIAQNSIPCAESLKATDIITGKESYCVMGCLYEAVARRRNMPFHRAFRAVNLGLGVGSYGAYGEGEHDAARVLWGVNTQKVDENDDVATLVPIDIGKVNSNDASPKELDKARKWQVRQLVNLARRLQGGLVKRIDG